MSRVDAEFKERVFALVAQIPKGKVMTYGQLAALAGAAWAAWEVGQIAHLAPCANLPACLLHKQPADLPADRTDFVSADSLHRSAATARSVARQELARSASRMAQGKLCPADLPWQRVVNKQGGLASGYPGGKAGHQQAIEVEGIKVNDFQVDVESLLWSPSQTH